MRYHFNPTWGIETGLQYTYLRSDFTQITDLHTERIQKVNYIGIPLKSVLNLWKHSLFSVYTSAGITLDIPVKATSEETIKEKNQVLSHEKTTIHPSLQGSTQLGIGIQYQLTPSISIYAEPNLNYYFKNDLNTIRKNSLLRSPYLLEYGIHGKNALFMQSLSPTGILLAKTNFTQYANTTSKQIFIFQ